MSDTPIADHNKHGHEHGRGRGRSRAMAIFAAGVGVELASLRRRGYRFGGNVVVRCRDGHLFTTIWIPGGSLKALRFGWWRFQRCPVGRHWTFVTPVSRASLSAGELADATAAKDIRIP